MQAVVTPAVLQWARKRMNLTRAEVAAKIGRTEQTVASWEEGEESPPYTLMERLAYNTYRLPMAVFYFPEHPNYPAPDAKFRRLPADELVRLSADTRRAMMTTAGYQDSLRQLHEGKSVFKKMKASVGAEQDPIRLARAVRQYIGLTLDEQRRFRTNESAFKRWRYLIEQAGVFSFKARLRDSFLSGFCLFDEAHPVILVNNSNAFTRQTFTLAHELGHILFGINGVTDVDESYVSRMLPTERRLEVGCNRFASELLVPHAEFSEIMHDVVARGVPGIEWAADRFHVSREVILRRCLDAGLVDRATYTSLSGEWNMDYLRRPDRRSRPSPYVLRLSFLGTGFVRLAYARYRQGRLTKAELAEHLNTHTRHVDNLLRRLE